jgi:hypothetical protein
MTTPGVIVFIFLVLAFLGSQLKRDFPKGLAVAVFLWVAMTTMVRIELPGALPELTIHRLILITVFCFWLGARRRQEPAPKATFQGYFIFWALTNFISTLGTEIDLATSLKRFLEFVLETWLFYLIISSSLRKKEEAIRIVHAAVLALAVVAAFAVLEHYTGFNPVDRFVPGYARDDQGARDVMATWEHRILLGTGMAMGVPLCFFLLRYPGLREKPKRLWFVISLFAAACFFSMSRGPWLGLGIAFVILIVLGSKRMRYGMAIIAALVGITLIVKPGVKDSLVGAYEVTVDTDSHKGGTFQYRMELWKIAHAKVKESTWRYFFGFGPGAGRVVDFEWELSYRESRHSNRKIESWDNHFAYALFQSGMLGFLAHTALFLRAVLSVLQGWFKAKSTHRDAMLCLFASCFVLFFMMTNVLIYAKQLSYLFWSLIAVALALTRFHAEEPDLGDVSPSTNPDEVEASAQPAPQMVCSS